MPQAPWEKYAATPGPWDKYASAAVQSTLLESRQAASQGEFNANQPESTLGSRLREAAIGVLDPFTAQNVAGTLKEAGGAGLEALQGKPMRAVNMAKGLITAPIQPVREWAGGIAAGDWDQAAHGAGGMLSQTAPAVAGAGAAGKMAMAKALQATAPAIATRLYESALKPGPRSNTLPEVQRMVATGLREAIPITERGTVKLDNLVDTLNTEIKNTIDTGSQQGATVNKFAVASRLSDLAKRLATQVNPETDLATLSESGNEFLRNQPSDIQASMAQALKQGTYQQLKGRAYGELKGAAVESQKTLARGLKEELAAQFPEIRDMNLRESDLLQLKDELESAVNRQRNKEMFGIGTPIVGGAVGAMTGSGPAGMAATALRSLIDRPGFKSKLAIALARAGRP